MAFQLTPIGILRSCFKEKFGIPRQGKLVPDSFARLEIPNTAESRQAIQGLEGFSHLWIVFVFHQAQREKSRVRPPRLGGTRKVGVFATRSPHRPNRIGMSAVKLEEVLLPSSTSDPITITLSGVDVLDHTPVLDIKPYMPECDSIPKARVGWTCGAKRPKLSVRFATRARHEIQIAETSGYPRLGRLIRQVLSQDPRPAFHAGREMTRKYGTRVADFDVHWKVVGNRCTVESLTEDSLPNPSNSV